MGLAGWAFGSFDVRFQGWPRRPAWYGRLAFERGGIRPRSSQPHFAEVPKSSEDFAAMLEWFNGTGYEALCDQTHRSRMGLAAEPRIAASAQK
jgi:hypothetical protein